MSDYATLLRLSNGLAWSDDQKWAAAEIDRLRAELAHRDNTDRHRYTNNEGAAGG